MTDLKKICSAASILLTFYIIQTMHFSSLAMFYLLSLHIDWALKNP